MSEEIAQNIIKINKLTFVASLWQICIITSLAKEVMFLVALVCLFVCL